MATKTQKTHDDDIVHIRPIHKIVIGEKAYGERATVQVRRGDLGSVQGAYEESTPRS